MVVWPRNLAARDGLARYLERFLKKRRGQLRIGTRLTVCFLAIVLLMLAADVVMVWQALRAASSSERLDRADQLSLATEVVHLDIDSLRNRLMTLADARDGQEFAREAAALRQKSLDDVTHTRQLLADFPDLQHDPVIQSTLEKMPVNLASEVDEVVGLATADDWPAVHLRLADQLQGLVDLSVLLAVRVDRNVARDRAEVVVSKQRAHRQLFIVLPVTALLVTMVVVAIGWRVTRTITEPLAELSAGAQALGRGEFQHEVKVNGEDELATLGAACNYATRQLRELYDGLRDSEEQWRAAFESNPTMYFMIDTACTLLSVNRFGAEQLGYSVTELVGREVLALFCEPDRGAARQNAVACIEQLGQTMRWEARMIRKDSTVLWARVTTSAVLLKKLPVLLLVCENITEQKRAEEAARRSERELRDVINTVPAQLWSASPDGAVDFFNRHVLDFVGLPLEDFSGWNWQVAIHPDDRERFVSDWMEDLKTGRSLDREVRVRRRDGEYRWFLIRRVPLRDDRGNILKWYGALTDIEDRKQAETLIAGEKRVLELVAKGIPLLEILDNLCRLVEEQTSGALASVLLVEGDRLKHGSAPSLPETFNAGIAKGPIGPCAGSCGTAAYYGKQIIVDDIATDPLWADYRDLALHHSLIACWSTPIFSSLGRLIGTFAMYYREPRRPTQRDQEIVEQITNLAGVAIERKLTYDQLQRSEAYLAEAQKLTHTGSWAYQAEGGPVYWSEENFRIWGLDPERGAPDLETVQSRMHPEDRDRAMDYAQQEVRAKRDFIQEFRIVLPDQSVRHIHTVGHPVVNASGEGIEVVGTHVDVTERKRAEEALRRSEAYLAEAQRLTHTGSFASDGNNLEIHYWSEEDFRIWGFDPRQGTPTREMVLQRIHPEDREKALEVVRKTGREMTDYDAEFRIVLSDGAVRHIHAVGHPMVNATGEVVEIVGTHLDVTGRKHAEEERERLRRLEDELAHINRVSMMGELAASLSHELKQPIAAAITNANTCLRWLTRDQPEVGEAREAVVRIVLDGNRAAEIIDRLRALYKKGAPSERVSVDVNQIAREMLVLMRSEANRYSIPMRTHLEQGLPSVSADRIQLQQVFLNLMLNGIEAMRESGGELTITSQLGRDGYLLISVSDAGGGLPPGKADQIFNAFFTTKPHGSGMGLAISRSIIESHGGRLWASANSGPGTTLYFTLPAESEK